MSDYTQIIEDRYWGYWEQSAAESESRLQNIPEAADRERWKKELESVRDSYTCSARRFLMKYLEQHAAERDLSGGTWVYVYQKERFVFSAVTEETVLNLTKEERDRYIRLLTLLASRGYQEDYLMWRTLMRRAMLRNRELSLLTREEGFQIAHALHFSLEEAEAFLVRVLDNEGFCYTRSEDLIEAFCFLHAPCNDCSTAREMKETYQARTAGIAKLETEEKAASFTRSVASDLPALVKQWQSRRPEGVAECFMEWLCAHASSLDLPGRSAFHIYRLLASAAYGALTGTMEPESAEGLLDFIQADEWSGFPDGLDEYQLTDRLLRGGMNEFDNPRRRSQEQLWRYITVSEKGMMTVETIGAYIPLLLTGQRAVSKADLLFLLWFVSELCAALWYGESSDDSVRFDRFSDFWTMAETLLEEANLPRFYAPHPLEQLFLASICQLNEETSPFERYENLCDLVLPEKKTRNRLSSDLYDKKNLERMRQEIRLEWYAGIISLEQITDRILEHFLSHASSLGQYFFTPDGISYHPNPSIVIVYPEASTGDRFDLDRTDYQEEATARERFRFLYGITLFLKEQAGKRGVRTDFRVNYKKHASLKVLKWEPYA